MAQTIKLKRSATAGNIPSTSNIALGEVAINTTDGKMFIKRSVGGTESVVQVGDTSAFLPLSGGTLTGSIDVNGSVVADGTASSSAPKYTFSGDTNTGLGYVGTDSVGFIAGGSRKFYVNGTTAYFQNLSGGVNVLGSVTSTGLTSSGDAVFQGNVTHNNNNASSKYFKLNVASSGDGHLLFQRNNMNYWQIHSDGSNVLKFDGYNGASSAVFSGAVTSTGLTVDGAATFVANSGANNLFIDGRSSDDIGQVTFRTNNGSSSYSQIQSRSNELKIKTLANIPMSFHTNNTERLNIENNGDISFYEDTGSTPKFIWSAASESLGIGRSPLSLSSYTVLDLGAKTVGSMTRLFGASGMSHQIMNNNTDMIISADDNDQKANTKMRLRTDGVDRVVIDDTGIDVTGTVVADGIESSGNFAFTAADGMQISAKETVAITIDSDDNDSSRAFQVLSGGSGSTESLIVASEDAGVNLYYNNAPKLATTATGIEVTGSVTSTGLEVNGTRYFDSDYNVTYYRKANHTTLGYQLHRDNGISYYEWNNGGTHSHDFQFVSNNSQILNLSTNGNVNIPNGKIKVSATTAPVARVDIAGNSDTVPALKIGSSDTYGHFFYDSSATGDLVIKRGEGGAQSESMRLDRSTGAATFSGSVSSTGQINAGTNLVAGTSVYSGNGVYYGSSTLSLKNSSSGSFLDFAANGNATFNSGNVIIPNGSLSIGMTSAATSLLDIRGSGNVDVMSKIINTGQTSNGRKTEFLFGKDNGANLSGTLRYVYDGTQANRKIELVHFGTSNGLSIANGGNALFSGSVTTSTILKSIGADTQTNVTASQNIGIHLQNTSNTDGNFTPIDFYNSTGFVTARIGAEFQDAGDRNTDLYFATRANGGSLTEKFRINSSGNVTFSGSVTANAGVQIDALNLDGRTIASTDLNGNINIHPNGSGTVNVSTSLMVGATTAPFAKAHIKDTAWSSGSPYGAVQLIEGNNVNDDNWGHLVITDTTTSNGSGGSIRFATGASSSLNPFAGVSGVSEGGNYGGLAFYTRPSGGTATERMKIDSGGHTSFTLGTNAMGTFGDSIGEVGSGNFSLQVTNSAGSALKPLGFRAEDIRFATGSAERMRISADGSFRWTPDGTNHDMTLKADGNLLVGKTASGINTAGHEFLNYGRALHTVTASTVQILNRKSNDGDIALFQKDGATVGSIFNSGTTMGVGSLDTGVLLANNIDAILPWNASTNAERGSAIDLGRASTGLFKDAHFSGTVNAPYIGATNTGLYFNGSYNAVVPYRPDTAAAVDNYLDLGMYSYRFDDVFATNGTIQTSDRNEKQDIEFLTEAEERVAVAAKGLLKKFRWKSSVAEKGDDARIHFGIIAQDLQAAFAAESLDAGRYAMFTSDTWTDEDGEEQTRMGVRYSELLAFIISAI